MRTCTMRLDTAWLQSFLWKIVSLEILFALSLVTMDANPSMRQWARNLVGTSPAVHGSVEVEVTSVRLVDDDHWAILTIVGEALSEPLEGKIAVGEVIRNRMRRGYASDHTVIGTVLFPKQFSMWDDRARFVAAHADDEHPSVQECIQAWKLSATSNVTGGAVLYHTTMIQKPWWATRPSVKVLKTIGRHIFYNDAQGA